MEISPIQMDELDPLTDERVERFRKELGADAMFIFIARNGQKNQYSRSYGMCPHEVIGMCLDLIADEMGELKHEGEEHEKQ